MVWLPDSEKFDDTFSRFDRIPARDGRTDGRTDRPPSALAQLSAAELMTTIAQGCVLNNTTSHV